VRLVVAFPAASTYFKRKFRSSVVLVFVIVSLVRQKGRAPVASVAPAECTVGNASGAESPPYGKDASAVREAARLETGT
jgi:hypothetical protein